MADIAIRIGVNGPAEDTNRVLSLLEHIYNQPQAEDKKDFSFGAYASDFTDSAIGIIASMSFVMNYTGADGKEKTFTAPLLRSFSRMKKDGQAAFSVTIPADSRQLIRVLFEQRRLEEKGSDPSNFIQAKAKELGLK